MAGWMGQKSGSFFAKVLSGALLIAGTTVGAGMLGLPIVTASLGPFPMVVTTLFVWIFMGATGYLLLETLLRVPQSKSLLSLSKALLGDKVGGVVGGAFFFLYFCLMVAYLAAGLPLVGDLFGWGTIGQLLFWLLFMGIVTVGSRWIDRCNLLLSFAMCGAYAFVLFLGSRDLSSLHIPATNWKGSLWAFPILFGAFGYHNILPSLASYFKKDRKVLLYALFWGTLIPCIVYLLWQLLIIGMIPSSMLSEMKNSGLPINHVLGKVCTDPHLLFALDLFALFAVTTSLLGVSFSLVHFVMDGLPSPDPSSRWRYLFQVGISAFVFIPPYLFAKWDPSIFEQALSLAGGIGEALLNGILPLLLFWALQKKFPSPVDGGAFLQGLLGRGLLCLILIISLGVMGIEGVVLFGKGGL